MIEAERLLESTEGYLKSLVCDVAAIPRSDIDPLTPFAELGVDSFRVLKIIKALEADFGVLPKTLLFENFNVGDLARYFVRKHARTLADKFGGEVPPPAIEIQVTKQPVATGPTQVRETARPMLLPEKQAFEHPEVGPRVREIFEHYKNEGSVSRGTRNIAPDLFIGSARRGFFNYSRSNNLILAYTYTGPDDYFADLAQELYEHCTARNLELNLIWAQDIAAVGDIPFSSTPFGALQRVTDLQSFTLQGAAMRRLRYQVSKFEKSGACRVEEYRCGTDPVIAGSIAAVIDEWCAGKTMVNPLIHIVKAEILDGTLNPDHRIFLTYVDDVLHNVILISPLAAQARGYLMDLEFYTQAMPLGGLEFAIVRIIETLKAEGCSVLSLGGTYGCKLQASANADPQVDKILDELRQQNIFNDEGNLQFKNKFRPENQSILLCRPVGKCTPDNVLDIIMMIADPARMQTSDRENHSAMALPEATTLIVDNERSRLLTEHDFNPLQIPCAQVDFDLKTDSWAQLQMPAIDNHTGTLYSQLQMPADLERNLQQIFPQAYFALTKSGRTAEQVFYRAWPKKGGVPQNLLFPTTLFHQIDQGFTPLELPHPEVFRLDSTELFKADLDESALRERLLDDTKDLALVCIELSNNAAGGHPVSIQHLKNLRALLASRSLPLVIDATRVIENALFVIERDGEPNGKDVWQVVREMLGYADVVIVSLAKDFCIPAGLIATNDRSLFESLQTLIVAEGCGLDAIDRKLAALTLQNRRYIETQARRRKDSVKRLWDALDEQGVPVVKPAGGHCVLIDVRQIPAFQSFEQPVASFLAWLYLNTGIRAGAHSVGMQKNTSLNALVRLAIPLGLKRDEIDALIERLTQLFARMKDIPELLPLPGPADAAGNLHARYRAIRVHDLSLEASEASIPVTQDAVSEPATNIFPLSARTQDELQAVAAQLREFLSTPSQMRAQDVAHTLQLDRPSFDHRLAIVAGSCEQLVSKLTSFLDVVEDADVMVGHTENAGAIGEFMNPAETREFIDLLLQGGDPHRLARLWSDGVIPDWRGLDLAPTGRKISLPGYPFAEQRPAPALVEVPPADIIAVERPGPSIEERSRLFVWQLLAQQRRLSLDDVDDDFNLMDMGITSLDMAEMTQSMKDKLDPEFSPIAFFECTTVRSLYQLLGREYAAAFEKMPVMQLAVVDGEQIPMPGRLQPEKTPESGVLRRKPLHVEDAESELPLFDLRDLAPAGQEPMRRIFLTGATGFLGTHVLTEILQSDPEAHVYCLVRASNKMHGLQRIAKQAQKFELLLDEARITIVCGDIDRPRLGMSEEDWELCCRETQQIVHASAHVNHIEGYSTFRESTQGMKEIIRLACSRRLKLVQFISSVTGCILKRGEEFSVFEKEDFVEEGENVWGGYGQSKWVQETFLRRAHAQGVPFVIYRFGELSGATQTGLGQTDDMLHRLLQMRLAVGCREKISSDVLDMLPVDFAAKLIVGNGRTPELWNAIVHATHLKPYSLANLYRRAQKHGLSFDPVTRSQYLAACYQFVRFIYSVNPVNGFVLECVLRDAEGSSKNRKMMDGYFSVIFPFEQDRFRHSLRTLQLTLPDWNALIERYFQRWSEEECGFLARVFDYQQWTQPRNRSMARQSVPDVALAGEGE